MILSVTSARTETFLCEGSDIAGILTRFYLQSTSSFIR